MLARLVLGFTLLVATVVSVRLLDNYPVTLLILTVAGVLMLWQHALSDEEDNTD